VTAKVLARAGAKHIFLVSRSGRVSYEGQGLEEDLAWLQSSASGAAVHAVRCDVSDESAVEVMLPATRLHRGRGAQRGY
jgi:NAD(P)-dependent dehydrogenase (short-subunit alcohol dehydrogenase family)